MKSKSRELLRQLVNNHCTIDAGTYVTDNESHDIWSELEEYFRAERVQGELEPDTEYLFFYSCGGTGLCGMQDEIILQTEELNERVYLYKM